MLNVSHLSKRYSGKTVKAVDDLSFQTKEGEIFGLLGLNGAGKSTTFKCIAGILPFDEGKIEICGFDVVKDEIKAKRNFAFIPDNHAVFEGLTGREYINFMADIYEVSESDRNERVARFCEMFEFEKYLDSQIRSYSHGMKQKIAIMGGIIHYPKLWILDEPLLGLDPLSIRQVQDFMRDYVKGGNTIVFSSHILDTVDKLCDRILVIDGGVSKGVFELSELRKEAGYDISELFFGLVRR